MKRGLSCLLIILTVGLPAVASCYNSDSPDCLCFHDTAAWNPSGAWIQDIALDTLGTRVSCVTHGGKPFYQMRLGLNSASAATSVAAMLDVLSGIGMTIYDREAWCSETISYWHREARIPYSVGYRRSDWHLDWQLTNTNAIRTFYKVEEILGAFLLFGGRGRWIEWSDLDYGDFRPGINAPAPGSYVLIRRYDDTNATWDGKSHSLMINEMTIYRNGYGEVVKVEVSLLEGNAGSPAQVLSTSSIDDLISYTPGGTEWLGNSRKILGFGVDLDWKGSPIYDPDRLHYERELHVAAPPFKPFPTKDPLWMRIYEPLVQEIVDYATKTVGGPIIGGPGPVIGQAGIPDGHTTSWSFGTDLNHAYPNGFTIDIDLLQDHPLRLEGIVLSWEGTIPSGYTLRYAASGEAYRDARPPMIGSAVDLMWSSHSNMVPIPFAQMSVPVRRIQLYFPPGSIAGDARLTEMRFIYDWGPSDEAESNPAAAPGGTQEGPLSIRVSASVSKAFGAAHTHVVTVAWTVSGGTGPYRLSLEVTGPDGTTIDETAQELVGERRFELTYPAGGIARVRVDVQDAAGAGASGSTSISLGGG